ncbi:MAG TPA: serine/threonine-protein kinase [Polyangiaceae bacterium]|nr:serine/threonine-protein kinase [Polyangiaceae bacterium]
MSPGTVLAGKYRLVSMLGHGGMGSVWRAERLGWQSLVAVKVMHAPGLQDPNALARFQRESHLAASLRSLHIVQVLDDGVDTATGTPFIVMELLEGETLAERLARMKKLKAPVVAQIISQIARALARAHDAGLIHRDLKPDNVLIVRNDDEEVVKVLDFGIAKWLASPTKHGPRTISGQMLGTPVYMSPEQFGNSANIDHRADLWSLGVIACECMTGVRPFQGDTLVSLALQVCSADPPRPSSLGPVPDGFDSWFLRAVSRDRERRFPSARIMAEELRGLCGHTPLLWEEAAAPPSQHLPREKTELEPVLELRRRTRASEPQFLPTDLGSVMPAVHSQPAPQGRGSRWWFALVGISMAALGFAFVMLLEGSNRSLDVWAARLREVTRELRDTLASGGPPAIAQPAPPAGPVPSAAPALPTQPSPSSSAHLDAGMSDAAADAAASVASP